MCGFSAKGPWCVTVDGVPYGAYTENQARTIAGLVLDHFPDKDVHYFKMLKYDDAGEDYSDILKMAITKRQLPMEIVDEATNVAELARFDREYSGGGKLAELVLQYVEQRAADSPAGHDG